MSLTAIFLMFSTLSLVPNETLCKGFLPENDWKIPMSRFQSGGISEQDFNSVLDTIQTYYAPVIRAKGGSLRIARNWTDSTVNASANRAGSTWVLNMYGGLARVPVMTKDAFMLVACHETGHHLGGAPKLAGWFGSDWASNEGQADYYATLDCMRYVMNDRDNQDFVSTHTIDPILLAKCDSIYSNQPERDLCKRLGTAGIVAAYVFQSMRRESTVPRLDTPDTHVVSQTDDDHPATQCRMDTYYAGAVCFHDIHQALSDDDPNPGSCSEAQGSKDGNRPRCWFKP